jgi:quercetin dioxygenase-like cupin family protein
MSRTLLGFAAGVVVGVGGLALAQQGHEHGRGGPAVQSLAAIDITEELGGKPAKASYLEVTFAPGAASAPHRHPGPVFGYVLEGEFETKVGDGPTRTLKAGDTFYEPTMALHAVSRNPSDKAKTRVLAIMLHPRDAKDLVIPEPAKGGK